MKRSSKRKKKREKVQVQAKIKTPKKNSRLEENSGWKEKNLHNVVERRDGEVQNVVMMA